MLHLRVQSYITDRALFRANIDHVQTDWLLILRAIAKATPREDPDISTILAGCCNKAATLAQSECTYRLLMTPNHILICLIPQLSKTDKAFFLRKTQHH